MKHFFLENGQNEVFIDHSNDQCSQRSRLIWTQEVSKKKDDLMN